METTEIINLEILKKLSARSFQTLKPTPDNSKAYIAQIKVSNYVELGGLITDLLKLCILALDPETPKIVEKNNEPINVGLILETVLQLFPLEEMEFLSNVGKIIGKD
ncbi:hypothetical protein [Flavobacterium salmonis]|uniref:Uncharacterized protein n=1 Tax=Flavobacterium salmonis TaxID=2654844 RepID=A0A6V6ZAT2_9FLAO|nr:hypothetical protein [Flavobacterium salmonis]CAD0008891.1 hypothetical protein FLAT13_04618 [Flavobacterium salmonis]